MAKGESSAPWEPLGSALEAFHRGRIDATIRIESDVFETEDVPARDYYRPLEDPLPELETEALRCCRGEVLDLGAGAGRHSLELQRLGLRPLAVDICTQAVEIMRERGVKRSQCLDFLEYPEGSFDSILMLMNGIGLAGRVDKLGPILRLLSSHLQPDGQILCDASSLSDDVDPEQLRQLKEGARGRVESGEVWFRLGFDSQPGSWYPWLFPSADALRRSCSEIGLEMRILTHGARGAYLARITRR